MLAGGVFFANAKKEYPAAAAVLKKAMTEQGLIASGKLELTNQAAKPLERRAVRCPHVLYSRC